MGMRRVPIILNLNFAKNKRKKLENENSKFGRLWYSL